MKRNADRAREAMRRWRAAHPVEHATDNRAYYARHRDERLAQSAEYHSANPEVGRARSANYRARKLAADGAFTPREWLALVEQHGGACAYCGAAGPLEADHRIPLARGGSNWIDNILPACRPMQRTEAPHDRARVPRASRIGRAVRTYNLMRMAG
ncbi:MAG TPA: HNH endonuclease signature motif containing protein [Candidatus Limnocylindria bacterium]|nr:HNH endonuclease signature motif containing protein [Candidatus Limnocylindria bacterium]